MDSKTIKLGKLFSRGKMVIIACDHGEFDDPTSEMVSFPETVSKINAAAPA